MPPLYGQKPALFAGNKVPIYIALVSVLIMTAGVILIIVPCGEPEDAFPSPSTDSFDAQTGYRSAYQQPPIATHYDERFQAILAKDDTEVAVSLPWGAQLTVADMRSLYDESQTPSEAVILAYIKMVSEIPMPALPEGFPTLPQCMIFPREFTQHFGAYYDESALDYGHAVEYAALAPFTTAESTPARWTHGVLLFPIHPEDHNEEHWYLVAVDMAKRQCLFYDPLGNTEDHYTFYVRNYLNGERRNKLGWGPIDWSTWRVGPHPYVAKLTHPEDANVFFMVALEHARRGLPIDMTQGDMSYYRKRIFAELLDVSFLPAVLTPEFRILAYRPPVSQEIAQQP